MSMALLVVTVSRVYTNAQTHHVVHIKYVQLFNVNYTSIKWFKKKKIELSPVTTSQLSHCSVKTERVSGTCCLTQPHIKKGEDLEN